MRFNVCVLLYGDHRALAVRCLGSVGRMLLTCPETCIDVRIGLNAVSTATRQFVNEFAANFARESGIPVRLFIPERNVYKYPIMRRMFYDEQWPLAEKVLWLDDDTYFLNPSDWHAKYWPQVSVSELLGQIWKLRSEGERDKWFENQRWYDHLMPQLLDSRTKKRIYRFCQGSFWIADVAKLKQWDWPSVELRHCGGDSALGELARHQKWKIVHFDYGVRINADNEGRHSKAVRRGYTEPVLGKVLITNPDLSHQIFNLEKQEYMP
jgi:hypothetical protein